MNDQTTWQEQRQLGIGASEIGILMGAPAFERDELDVYLSKIGPPVVNDEDIADFRRGHTYEALALALAAEAVGVGIDRATGGDVQRFCFTAPDAPHVRCTLDGRFDDGWLAEAKAPRPWILSEMLEKGIRDLYAWQMQAQLACVPDAPGVRFILYDVVEVKVHVVEVERDDEMIRQLKEKAEQWWADHVDARIPPDPDQAGEGAERRIIKVPGEYVDIDGDAWLDALEQFVDTAAALDQAKEQHDKAKSRIQAAMKESGLGKVRIAGHRFKWHEQPGRITFDKRRLSAEHPEIDMSRYEKIGKPFFKWGYWAPKGVKS